MIDALHDGVILPLRRVKIWNWKGIESVEVTKADTSQPGFDHFVQFSSSERWSGELAQTLDLRLPICCRGECRAAQSARLQSGRIFGNGIRRARQVDDLGLVRGAGFDGERYTL